MSTMKMKVPKSKRTFVAGRVPNVQDSANTWYIAAGEIAFNLTDKKAFTNDGTATPMEIGANVNILHTRSIIANNSTGQYGQALLSDGADIFWGDVVGTGGGSGFTGSRGATGFVGSQGAIGFTGSQGAGFTGSVGFTGSQGVGFTGSQGVIGFTGSQGAIGFTGSQGVVGFTGSQGVVGFTGSQGTTGFAGSQGVIGFTGSQGTTGFTGSQGVVGFTGSQGVIGFTGSQGVIGFTGSQGVIGFTGSQGVGFTGSQGTTGFVGSQGNKGGTRFFFDTTITAGVGANGSLRFNNATIASVTQVYVNVNDINGTSFASWLASMAASTTPTKGHLVITNNLNGSAVQSIFSITAATNNTTYYTITVSYVSGTIPTNNDPLVAEFNRSGDLGFTGSQGVGFTGSASTVAGPTGFTGSQGIQGVIGFTGSQGVIGFTGSQGVIGFTGSQGAGFTGSQGVVGFAGSQGVQGVIGFTGSQGTQGTTGFTGSQGIQGVIGFTGSQGTQGVVGFTGSQGIQGGIGFTGSQGIVGFTGSQGVIGFTGSQGVIGFTGSQGTTGFTGSQGTTGFIGSQGNKGGTRFFFDTTITAGVGANGSLRFDNATIASVTQIFVNINDINGTSFASWLASMAASTTPTKGHLVVTHNLNGSAVQSIFSITAATNNTTYYTLSVAYVSGTIPANNDPLVVDFNRTGDLGFTGSQGGAGGTGFTGSQGIQGVIGFTGSQGTQGTTGFTGSQGIQGVIGFTGSQGVVGFTGSQGAVGFTGSQGIIGFTGSQGTTGFTGSQGTTGFTGSQGVIGFTGSAGTASAAGTDTMIQFNDAGAIGGSANLVFAKGSGVITSSGNTVSGNSTVNSIMTSTGTVILNSSNSFIQLFQNDTDLIPAANSITLSAVNMAGRMMPEFSAPDQDSVLQPNLGKNRVYAWLPTGLNSASALAGFLGSTAITSVGTLTGRAWASTNILTRATRLGYVSVATAAGLASARVASAWLTTGSGTINIGSGFTAMFRFGVSDAAAVTGARMFVGLSSTTAALTNVEYNTLLNSLGVAQLSTDATQWYFVYGGSAAQTAVALGTALGAPTLTNTLWDLVLFASPAQNGVIGYQLKNLGSGVSVRGGITPGTPGTQTPLSTTAMTFQICRGNNATALAVGFDVQQIYIETDS